MPEPAESRVILSNTNLDSNAANSKALAPSVLEFNPAAILLEFDNTPLATEKFLEALSETDSLNLSPTAGVPEIVTANPLARLKVEPDVKVNVPELAPVVKFVNENELEPVMVISYLSAEIFEGSPLVAVYVAEPVLLVLINTVVVRALKKLFPVDPSIPNPCW